jgi:hypothetical protein
MADMEISVDYITIIEAQKRHCIKTGLEQNIYMLI